MAEGTYEYECMRAELLGIAKPNQEEFEKARTERLQQEQEELDAAEAALLETQEEALQSTGGKLDELNSILSSTQKKINRFKQSACGSLSNIFSKGSMDIADGAATPPTTSATASRRNTTASGGSCSEQLAKNSDINTALEQLEEIQHQDADDVQPVIPTEKIRKAKMDIDRKMNSHLTKLDSLINKAEQADVSMFEQTKQMRKLAK